MIKYIFKRIAFMILTLFLIVSITLTAMLTMPGNPYNNEKLTSDQIAQMDRENGFDRPIPVQFVDYWVKGITEGDWGRSFGYQQDVGEIIAKRLPVSIQLGIISVSIGTIVGISFGVLAALRKNSFWDYFATAVAIIGVSFPSFVLASYTQFFLSTKLGLFPVIFSKSNPMSLVLPIFSLSVFAIASVSRMTRSEMVELEGASYVTLARAKGLSNTQVNIRHKLRNSLVGIITVLGPLIVSLTVGSLTIERIFNIPGIGDVLTKAVLSKDIFLVVGVTAVFAFEILLMNLIVDILYGFIDPRIKVAGGKK